MTNEELLQDSSTTIIDYREQAQYLPSKEDIVLAKNAAKQLLNWNKLFIFNTDLDGMVSAMILSKFLSWDAIGLCACSGSKNDCIWLDPKYTEIPTGTTFVDMWVDSEEYNVIDQHIVAHDESHLSDLRALPGKLNPNILWGRTAMRTKAAGSMQYRWKYPFGCVHFLIACLESLGVEIPLNNRPLNDEISTFDLLLRADDACRTSSFKFRVNACSWWSYLTELGGNTTKEIAEYACELKPDDARKRQTAVEAWIRVKGTGVGWIGKDGKFSRHLRNQDSRLDKNSQNLIGSIFAAFEQDAEGLLTDTFTVIQKSGERGPAYSDEYVNMILKKPTLFSYAFTSVYGPGASAGFSTSCSIT